MRTISSAALEAINARESGVVFVTLLTITHPTLANPIRVSDAGPIAGITSRSNAYPTYPFDISLPDDDPDKLSEAALTIDNSDLSIIKAIRSMGLIPATVLIEVVTSLTPGTVEVSTGNLTLRNVVYDAVAITGTLRFEELFNEPFPGDVVSPATFPSVFLTQ